MTLVSVTSSWVPPVSLTGSVDPSCPVLVPVGGALVPGGGVPAVLATGVAAAAALCVRAGCRGDGAGVRPWCGGDGVHDASTRTAVRLAAAASAADAVPLWVEARCPIIGLLHGQTSPPAAR